VESPEDDLSVTARLAHFLQLPVCAPRYRLAPEPISISNELHVAEGTCMSGTLNCVWTSR